MTLAIAMRDIHKTFGPVVALGGVSFAVERGSIHALCGENGAGKSTLMKILAGIYPAGTFSGEILIGGGIAAFKSIRDSEQAGIAIINQELALVPELSIAENIFLGREPTAGGLVDELKGVWHAKQYLHELGLDIDPRTLVKDLGIGQQQLVEIAKAISKKAQILVLDEPTSALAEHEVSSLLALLRSLKGKGVTSIIISHKLDEVFAIADEITVLRDGKSVATFCAAKCNSDTLVAAMVGRELKEFYPYQAREIGEIILDVTNLSVARAQGVGGYLCRDVNFSLRKGEIVGISGLMGAGRTELLMGLFGVYGTRAQGKITLAGSRYHPTNCHHAIACGLSLISEDRKKYGLILDQSVEENLNLATLPSLANLHLISAIRAEARAQEDCANWRIKCPHLHAPVRTLSGGNQQKVVIAKYMATAPKVLLLDEPTRGIDIGAKAEIYTRLFALAKSGMAILVASSEMGELLGLCDRILVMAEGAIQGELPRQDATQEKVLKMATGLKKKSNDMRLQ